MAESRKSRSNNAAVGVVLALVAVLFTPTPASAASGTTTLVSIAFDGTQGNGASFRPSVSADGRYVAFSSLAPNLDINDNNGASDVFVRDTETGTTSQVSVASDGTKGNRASSHASISANGRFVAFMSSATNLAPGDTNNVTDIFVHDRQTATTTRVSVMSGGVPTISGPSEQPSISADGRFIVFRSTARLVVDKDNTLRDIFIHDRVDATTTRVSKASDGTQANSDSSLPTVSGDGRYVAFTSAATNLVSGDTNGTPDVFVHDRQTATNTRVSVGSGGTEANGGSQNDQYSPDISLDGRYVAFGSQASNLVSDDTNGHEDIFVHDRQTVVTTRVSKASDATEATSLSEGPAISGDGRYVGFHSFATNLVPGDTNNVDDIFVHDRQTATTTRVSVASDSTQANSASRDVAISGDGRYVGFASRASNLVSDDTNAADDAFIHDTLAPAVSVGDVAVYEGDGGTRAAVFTVSLSHPAPDAVTVAYATVKGTARGTDFTAKSGTVSFAAGSTSATVKIPVSGDTSVEGDESFTLVLSSPVGAGIADASGVGTIFDDDPGTGRRLAIGDVSVHEGNSGGRVAVFNVSLSTASTASVTVNFATAQGTAIGADFTGKSGTLSFAPGITSMNVKVAITPDTIDEADESFTVHLSNSNGPLISDGIGVGTIIDND